MTDDEYQQVQDSIALVSSVINGLPLDEFVDTAGRSLAMGPYADPALYAKVSPKLMLLLETAVHLLEIKKLNATAREKGIIR